PALVARRPLRAGHRIVSTDLERGVAPVQAKAVFEENRAVGRLLDVDVAAGEPLVESALRAGAVLFKGETLTVTSSNGRAEARRTAVALEDGRVDEVVRVKNPDSKKEFRVRVTGPGAGDAVEE
ncbi:MAG: flagellar basal body P-ring formation protein FlgA, partial [Candidatus Brocadiae bacterium]|nr:flagellar basal body P-ring formation protein FlgA [Candidatus Brocadiia bacterium]